MPEAARNQLKALCGLLQFAVAENFRADDPTQGVKLPKFPKTGGFATWTEDEIHACEARHPIGSPARLAFALLLYTVQRRGDVIRMGRQHLRNGTIQVRQEKIAALMEFLIRQELQIVLDVTPSDHLTFLVTERGQPFNSNTFGRFSRKWCNEAGLPKHCSAHGLRKAAARRLAEAGCSPHQITAIIGHASLREIERQTKAVDQVRLAREAIRKELEQTLANLPHRLAKT